MNRPNPNPTDEQLDAMKEALAALEGGNARTPKAAKANRKRDDLSWRGTKEARRHMRLENRKYGKRLVRLSIVGPRPGRPRAPNEAWRSADHLVQVWYEDGVLPGLVRLSVTRTMTDHTGDWLDGITWDDLQRLKAECGRGHLDAVEVYPAEDDLVDVASVRHLWVLPAGHDLLPFKWTNP